MLWLFPKKSLNDNAGLFCQNLSTLKMHKILCIFPVAELAHLLLSVFWTCHSYYSLPIIENYNIAGLWTVGWTFEGVTFGSVKTDMSICHHFV